MEQAGDKSGNTEVKVNSVVTKAMMAVVDARYPTPEERAKYIHAEFQKHFPQLTTWDMVCFCTEYLAYMVSILPAMEEDMKKLVRTLYFTHYIIGENYDLSSGVPRENQSQHNDAEPVSGE